MATSEVSTIWLPVTVAPSQLTDTPSVQLLVW
jgi:hypothetical protein